MWAVASAWWRPAAWWWWCCCCWRRRRRRGGSAAARGSCTAGTWAAPPPRTASRTWGTAGNPPPPSASPPAPPTRPPRPTTRTSSPATTSLPPRRTSTTSSPAPRRSCTLLLASVPIVGRPEERRGEERWGYVYSSLLLLVGLWKNGAAPEHLYIALFCAVRALRLRVEWRGAGGIYGATAEPLRCINCSTYTSIRAELPPLNQRLLSSCSSSCNGCHQIK